MIRLMKDKGVIKEIKILIHAELMLKEDVKFHLLALQQAGIAAIPSETLMLDTNSFYRQCKANVKKWFPNFPQNTIAYNKFDKLMKLRNSLAHYGNILPFPHQKPPTEPDIVLTGEPDDLGLHLMFLKEMATCLGLQDTSNQLQEWNDFFLHPSKK